MAVRRLTPSKKACEVMHGITAKSAPRLMNLPFASQTLSSRFTLRTSPESGAGPSLDRPGPVRGLGNGTDDPFGKQLVGVRARYFTRRKKQLPLQVDMRKRPKPAGDADDLLLNRMVGRQTGNLLHRGVLRGMLFPARRLATSAVVAHPP